MIIKDTDMDANGDNDKVYEKCVQKLDMMAANKSLSITTECCLYVHGWFYEDRSNLSSKIALQRWL